VAGQREGLACTSRHTAHTAPQHTSARVTNSGQWRGTKARSAEHVGGCSNAPVPCLRDHKHPAAGRPYLSLHP
jgi:hypothetical protein